LPIDGLEMRPRRRPDRAVARAHRIFVAPAVLALVVLGGYPLAFILLTAFSRSTLGAPFQAWVGGDNVVDALTDGDVVASLVRNVVYALLVAAASLVLGIVAALALEVGVRRGSIVRTLLLLPLITPPVVVAVLWKLVFNPTGGLFAIILGAFGHHGAPVAVLSSPTWAIVGLGVADVWEWTPIITLLVFAALLGRDPEVREAAALDGAHGWRMFRSITLPSIGGTIAAAFLIRVVLAFKVFDLVFVLTSGGPGTSTTTPSYLIYQDALQQFDLGRAGTVTLLLAIVVTVVTLPIVAIARRFHDDARPS
jgi:multiple sugar transport system permease protein